MSDERRLRVASERQALARDLGSLVARPPVVCDPGATIAEVARLMTTMAVGSVVVVDRAARPCGIVTSHDLVSVAAGGGADRPVEQLMSRELVSLAPQSFAYEAVLIMIERRIRHVLVIDEGRLIGVVSERDLFALQRLGLSELTMEIRLAGSLEALKRLAREVRRLAASLVEQGTAPEPLTLFISVLNDRLTQRVIEVARRRHDLDRIRWAWLAFGSEGRYEQTFSTDQDNGLAFEATSGISVQSARARLLPFAREVNEWLDECGFPLCEGNIMASNPALCLTLEEWRAKIAGWLDTAVPQALLDAAICFDLRAIHGDGALVERLGDWIAERVPAHPSFLRHFAQAAVKVRPPLGRFGSLVAEDAPGGRHTINLKANGTRIFVDAARVLALANGRRETNTAARLRAVREALGQAPQETAALIDAFYFVQGLRLRMQAGATAAPAGARSVTEDAANRVDPDALNAFEQVALKESFRLARLLQTRLELDYRL